MTLFGVSMAALLASLAPVLVPFLYGEAYFTSVAILQVLAWVLIPIFLDFPIGSMLNATHRAAQKTSAMGIAMVINASMNWILIPEMGAIGAAWSALASFITLYGLGVWFVRKEIDWMPWARLHLQGAIVAVGIWLFVDWTSGLFHPLIVTAGAGLFALLMNVAGSDW
jgi:O-antigen/teichoic acid export membrane protein